jgi:hypothetical protein
MEHEGSLPYIKQHATEPHPQPVEFRPQLRALFLTPIGMLSLYLSLCLGLQSYLTPSNSPTKIVHSIQCVLYVLTISQMI